MSRFANPRSSNGGRDEFPAMFFPPRYLTITS